VIVKRGKGYGVSVYDSALKRKRWVGTFRTLGEAREAERMASRRRRTGRLTCGEFTELWLTDYARAAGATRRTYRYGVAAFVKEFGHVRLSEFDRLTARSWAMNAPQSNVRIVRAMFTDAIDDQLHPGPNPFANLRLEQSRGRKDLIALTEDELAELCEKALEVLGEFGPTFRAMVVFSAYVGLRPGELFALERADVGREEVAIRQNLDGTGTIKAPKNGRERIVVLPPPAREALADVPVRLDVPWQFVTPRGRRFTKSSLYYYWNPVRAAFGRPGDLRPRHRRRHAGHADQQTQGEHRYRGRANRGDRVRAARGPSGHRCGRSLRRSRCDRHAPAPSAEQKRRA
jgi:hypothetical protein